MSLGATAHFDDASCFHCGEPMPAGALLRARIAGVDQPVCCIGCQAVAEAIAGAGLDAYYDRRSTPGRSGAALLSAPDPDLAVLDTPGYQNAVVQVRVDGTREVSLLLEGITCAACIWLIERRLQALAGVVEAAVNFSTQRAYVRWRNEAVGLSGIVAAIRAVGYDAEPFDPARSETRRRRDTRTSLWRLFVAAFGMMQVMMYAVPAYMAHGDMAADIEALMRWASLVLTLPVIAFSALPFFSGALRDLKARTAGMDVPVALGIVVAFAASVRNTFTGTGEVYFDSITMFVFLLLAARHLEGVLRARAGEATERLGRLLPAFASRLKQAAGGGEVSQRIAVADLMRGDRVVIAAGESVPADGVVESGTSEVDESLLTGESRRVAKRSGAALIGGSVNIASRLVMTVERVGADTVVAGIGRLLDRAGADKPRLAQLADRIAARFVAAILLIAAFAGLAWWLVDPQQALPIAVTVLVITCPCALSLATPAALAAATGSLTRLGVLITHGHALETLARATHFVFDKTGTLTTGELELAAVLPLGRWSERDAIALAAALERDSHHPLARAFRDAAATRGCTPVHSLHDVRDVAGGGIEAMLNGRTVRIGHADFVAEVSGKPIPSAYADMPEHLQAVALGDDRGWIALFTLRDELRQQAQAVIAALIANGRKVHLLTGDRASIARYTARELGIAHVEAEARPEDKHRYVQALQREGAIVAMIGDGVNDAPVLAQAQVSVAMGRGADIARASADIVLVDSALERLNDIVAVARKTDRVVKENLAWAMLYNVVAVPIAVAGWVTPLLASIGMAASSILVVANALRAAHPALWRRGSREHALPAPMVAARAPSALRA